MTKYRSVGGVVLGVALLTSTGSMAQSLRDGKAAVRERPAQTDAQGRVVRSAAGQRLLQPRQAPPARPHAGRAALDATAGRLRSQGTPQARQPQPAAWSMVPYGSGIGATGIVTRTDSAGVDVFLGGNATGGFGANDFWQVLQFRPGSTTPNQVFASNPYSTPIVRLRPERVAGTTPRLLVGLADGTIERHDMVRRTLLSRESGPCATRDGLQAVTTADLNGDGSDEMISVCADASMVVTGPGYPSWRLTRIGGSDIAVGQMDDDPALEIATTGGKVVDSASRTVQWARGGGFGDHLAAADTDGDGRDELIVAEGWYRIWAIDVERKLPQWSLVTDLDIDALLMADVDGNGIQELLYGDGQWGSVHVIDTATQTERGRVDNPEHGVTAIAVADVDGNGRPELLWGAGWTSTGPDHLYVADLGRQQILWENQDISGPFIGPALGDLDGDGAAELVFASAESNSGYDSGRIFVLDARTRALRGVSDPVAGNQALEGLRTLVLRDLDGDGRQEILIGADALYDGLVEAYRFDTSNRFSLVWANADRPSGTSVHSLEILDTDGDGRPEVIAGLGSVHTGSAGPRIVAYDLATGREKWASVPVGRNYWSAVSHIAVGDFDRDADADIAAIVAGESLYLWDATSHLLQDIVRLEATVLLGDNAKPALLVGDSGGWLREVEHNGTDYAVVRKTRLAQTPIDGLQVGADQLIWFGSAGVVRARDREVVRFETRGYGEGFGRTITLTPTQRALSSAGPGGVYGFRLAKRSASAPR